MTGLRGRWPTSATRCQTRRLAMSCGASALRAPGVGREAFKGEVKILTSCPSCLQGLSRFSDDAGTAADYIVVEMAKRILGANWLEEYVARANSGGIERVLV